MMPLGLFRSATFSGVNALTLLLYGALGGAFFLLPFALISVHGYSATMAGAVFLPFTAIMAGLSRWSGGLLDRVGARLPLIGGPVLVAVGFVLFALAGPETSYAMAFLLPVSVVGLGIAVTVAPLTATVITAVPGHQTGVASGINNAVSSVASLFAIAAFGALALGRRRLRGADYSRSRRTRSMKPSVAAERSSARQARLSGTFRAGRPFSGR
jgi:MFS family permease